MAVIGAAVAFAVAGAVASEATYLINKATDHTADEAAKRNKAMMDLQEAQADYARRKQAQAEWLNEEMRKESHAEVEYKNAEETMDAYFEATHGISRQEALGPEPTLADFYTPSDTTKNIEIGVLVGTIVVVGGFVYNKYVRPIRQPSAGMIKNIALAVGGTIAAAGGLIYYTRPQEPEPKPVASAA
jgi:hypothetical protein